MIGQSSVGPGLGRVRVDGLRRDHAAGDDDAADRDRRVGQRDVHEQRRAVGVGQPLRPGRRQDRARRDRHPPGLRRAGARGCRTRRDRRDRPRSGTTARPPTSATGSPSATRRDAPRAISAARLGRSPAREQRVEDLPVGAVPADDEYTVGHGGQDTGAAARRAPAPPAGSILAGMAPRPARNCRGRGRPAGASAASTLGDLAARHGTPLQVYDEATLRGRARAYREGLLAYPGAARAVFACKAQRDRRRAAECCWTRGSGMDVASEGELAVRAGRRDARRAVIVHGNNKSDADLSAALAAGAGLVVLDHAASSTRSSGSPPPPGCVQPVLVRVTPGHRRRHPPQDRDRPRDSKFGLRAGTRPLDALRRAAALEHLAPGRPARAPRLPDSRSVDTYLEAAAWLAGVHRPRAAWASCRCSTSAAGSPSPTPTATGRRTSRAAVDGDGRGGRRGSSGAAACRCPS